MGKKTRSQRERQMHETTGMTPPVPSPPATYDQFRSIEQELKKARISKGLPFGKGQSANRIRTRGRRRA